MNGIKFITFLNLIFGASILAMCQPASIPHLEKKGNVTQLIVNDKPFLMLGGELHNSSMGGVEYMRPIWKRMAYQYGERMLDICHAVTTGRGREKF